MSTAEIILARQSLRAAEAEAEKQRRAEAKAKIVRLRREGAKLQQEFRKLAAQVNLAQADRLRLHGELLNARSQVLKYSTPLDPLEFPDNAEIAAHRRQLLLWKHRQIALRAASQDARRRETVRPQAVALAKRLEHLRYEIVNLTAVAEGRRPGQLEGGVYQGLEDFIGNLQTNTRV